MEKTFEETLKDIITAGYSVTFHDCGFGATVGIRDNKHGGLIDYFRGDTYKQALKLAWLVFNTPKEEAS